MNIFFVHEDPSVAARSLPDKLVVKMPLETAQLLSTAVNEMGGSAPYKSTHKNHPSALWCRESPSNFNWLVTHGLALCAEYSFRYGKRHKCEDVIHTCSALAHKLNKWPSVDNTYPPLCMPEQYKSRDVVLSYRSYMIGEKQHYAKWTKRTRPEWFVLKAEGNL